MCIFNLPLQTMKNFLSKQTIRDNLLIVNLEGEGSKIWQQFEEGTKD